MATPANKKPIMDVAKPGETPADATSRPVIASREAFIKDPMVTKEADASDEKPLETVPELSPVSKKVIKPLSETEEPEAKPTEAVADTAVVDAVLDQVSDTKKAAALDKEAEERQAAVEKLVEQKKYFVPLATAQHRRNNKIAVVVLAALLPLLVGIVLAIDAGVIEIGVTLPFDLIK